MTIAAELAEFVVRTHAEALPELALERARMVVASTVASAAAGRELRSARIMRALARERGGTPEATLWFHGGPKLPVAAVVRVNAVMSDAAASDDSDLRGIAHIGTIVATAAIATAERTGASGLEVLRAMVLGYEVAGRIDEALIPGRRQRGFHGSVATIFGGAVATGVLLGLTQPQMAQAIALAATSIGGLGVAANTSEAREYHAGLAALLGVEAALAARHGYVAEETVLEAPRGFFDAYGGQDLPAVTGGLGDDWDIVTDLAIKLMPGGHPHHAAAEAAANAAIAADVHPADVERIVVSQARLRALEGPLRPTDLVGAAHSLAYFISAAVADRGFTWDHVTAAKLDDPAIVSLLDKVAVDPDPPPAPDRFPYHHGATVSIVLRDGRSVREHVASPRGSSQRGIDWADVDAKYRRLAPQSGLAAARLDAALQAIHDLAGLPALGALAGLLAGGD